MTLVVRKEVDYVFFVDFLQMLSFLHMKSSVKTPSEHPEVSLVLDKITLPETNTAPKKVGLPRKVAHRSQSRWRATPERWLRIHRSCAIYFPGGISIVFQGPSPASLTLFCYPRILSSTLVAKQQFVFADFECGHLPLKLYGQIIPKKTVLTL